MKTVLLSLLLILASKPLQANPALFNSVFNETNRLRVHHNLEPLQHSSHLDEIAQEYACQMAHNPDQRNALQHIDAFGRNSQERAQAFGYEYPVGENIARGVFFNGEEIVKGWYFSNKHRRLLLHSEGQEMGLGACQSSDMRSYWVQLIGL